MLEGKVKFESFLLCMRKRKIVGVGIIRVEVVFIVVGYGFLFNGFELFLYKVYYEYRYLIGLYCFLSKSFFWSLFDD